MRVLPGYKFTRVSAQRSFYFLFIVHVYEAVKIYPQNDFETQISLLIAA